MATEYYVDGPGNYLGAWPSGHSDIPGGATEVGSAPPINDTQIWGFPNWGAIVPATVSVSYDQKSSKNSGIISEFNVFGWNSALTESAYSKTSTAIIDNTAGSEDGSLKYETCQDGALVEVLTLEKGMTLNGAAGGDQGVGSINSTAYHINGGTAIESGATANDTNANLKARANHTGTQTMSTISDAGSVATLNEIAEGTLSAAVQTKLNNTAPSKFDATAAPTANDDSANTGGNGTFTVGSVWIDVTNDEAYRCVDDTATAAIWINTTLTTSELGTIATQNANAVNITGGTITGITDLAVADGGTGASTDSNARINLGLIIGTDVQAWAAVLDATTASFLTADKTKLDNIETAADVTDTTNVTAAGALMDSEVDASLQTFALPDNTTISAFGATIVDDADAAAVQVTLGLVIGTNVQAEDAVLTDLAGLTLVQGDILYHNGTNLVKLAPGTTGQFLKTQGAAANIVWDSAGGGGGITLGTELSTTSGTAFTFTGIPSGTKRVTMNFEGNSLNGSDHFLIQIGDSGGIETSGYASGSSNVGSGVSSSSSTAGFILRGAAGATVIGGGTITFTLKDSANNTWIGSGMVSRSDAAATISCAGSKSLSAELTQIRLTRTGSNSFDAGSVNITYE